NKKLLELVSADNLAHYRVLKQQTINQPVSPGREDQFLAGPRRCVIRNLSTRPKHSATLPVALPQVNSPSSADELSEILRRAACSP
ncbi:hypothetical protein, partial [Kocuria palustris]